MLKSKIDIKEKVLLDETVGEDIGYDLGVSMVKAFYDQTGEGNAQFVGKNILNNGIVQASSGAIKILDKATYNKTNGTKFKHDSSPVNNICDQSSV